jgi:hypothetical protein
LLVLSQHGDNEFKALLLCPAVSDSVIAFVVCSNAIHDWQSYVVTVATKLPSNRLTLVELPWYAGVRQHNPDPSPCFENKRALSGGPDGDGVDAMA